jgi:hypothetical protein
MFKIKQYKFIFVIILFHFYSCLELKFELEKISKSIAYQNKEDFMDNDYYYIFKNEEYNKDIKIIYQTGNINNEIQMSIIPYDNNLDLYINIFSKDDCYSDNINSFLFCKENLMRHYYATFNLYKTLDDLYINKKIKNKIFGQEYSGNNKDLLKLYIGDTRPMDQGKYSYKCKMNNNNECILNYISIIYNPINRKIENNETINNLEINSFAEINFGYSNIKGTYDVGKKIFDFLLSLPSFKNKCYIISSRSITIEDEYIKLICNSDTNIYDLPKIIFSFGEENKIQILLTSDLLFYKQYDIYGDKFYYMTRLEFSKLNKNWIIGRPLLNDVNLIYDLEKKYITFIFDENNDLNIINLPNKSFKIIVIKIFEVIGVVLLIFIVLFICFYCYRKRKIKVIKEYMNSNVQRLHDI